MAAYAAVVSLRHIIEQIQRNPRPPISLNNEQVESLTEKLTFLQVLLEGYSIDCGGEDLYALESRIADAAYAAEDAIESHIVDQIQAASTSTHRKRISFISFFLCREATSHVEKPSSVDLYDGLNKVIQNLDLIKRDVTEIAKKIEIPEFGQTRNSRNLMHSAAGSLRRSSSLTGKNSTMVGFDDILIEVMDKLTGQQSSRKIIPIVGMGGIGKTTLAKNVYVNPLIVQYFDFRGWVTISEEYDSKEMLLEVLVCLKTMGSRESLSGMMEFELGEKLHKSLSGRRYLIVMDDVWSMEAWDKVKFFFPDNNGSRIMITTRVSNLASELGGSCGLEMSFLDEDKSWNLLCKTVFGEEGCPTIELEQTGKKIAKNCRGLPLSIVVIGGFLTKSQQTQEYWEYIAENLSSIVNLQNNERCFRILRLSYNHLPVHLKPCFLYMGLFPEDHKIRVSTLIKLWVAEGFLKPISGKSLEIVAEEYLKDIIDRNLILVHELGSGGNIKSCTVHDLVRDLCIKEAKKDEFFRVADTHRLKIGPQNWLTQRRIGFHRSAPEEKYTRQVLPTFAQSPSLARSLLCSNINGVGGTVQFRLIRVLNVIDRRSTLRKEILEDSFQLGNLRYLNVPDTIISKFPSSVYQLWNLQTLVINPDWQAFDISSLFDIWKMTQLRHVQIRRLFLPDPPSIEDNDFVALENLHTLTRVKNFKCDEEVVKRIPNIKKLKIWYTESPRAYCLNNLCRLHILESLCYSFYYVDFGSELVHNLITFPQSLKKLSLRGTKLSWEDMTTKIGSLPHLQVLKLNTHSVKGPEWETVEENFRSLKYLKIGGCVDFEYWRTESTHFPCLENLVLNHLDKLEEIPAEIGDIPTLKSIVLYKCTESAVISADKIRREQEDLGNEDLQVRVLQKQLYS